MIDWWILTQAGEAFVSAGAARNHRLPQPRRAARGGAAPRHGGRGGPNQGLGAAQNLAILGQHLQTAVSDE